MRSVRNSGAEWIISPSFIVSTSILIFLIILPNLPSTVVAQGTEPELNFYIERELFGHSDEVTALAWSANGQSIASGSNDNTTRIWSTGTWSIVKTLYHSGSVNAISWSKTSFKLGISYGDGTIEVWNSIGWTLLDTLTDHSDIVMGLDWNHDSTRLSTGDNSGNIKIWDTTTWNSIQTLDLGSQVRDLQWSNNGDKLAACSRNGTISIWETTTWTNLRSFDTTFEDISCESIAWSPDGSKLASSSWENKVVVWDTASWEALQTLDTESNPQKVIWSPDDTYLAFSVMGGIQILNTTEWGFLNTTELNENSQVVALTMSPDGDNIASSAPQGTNNSVIIWGKNLSPVLDPIGTQEATEDQLFTFTVTASDVDQLTFSDNSTLFDINPNSGQISFIPTNEEVGEHIITVTVSDGKGGIDSESFILTIINVDDPPVPVLNWHYGADFVNITLRMGGQIGNSVTLSIEEDGIPIEEVTVERVDDFFDEEKFHFNMNLNKSYEATLNYSGSIGQNPVAVTFERNGIAHTKHLGFDSNLGIEQTEDLQMRDYFSAMGLVIFDAGSSFDVDSIIVKDFWDFGDGTYGEGINVVHSYSENDNFIVSLIVESDNGINSSITTEISMYEIPDKEALESILKADHTLEYLESTNNRAVFMDSRRHLRLEDSLGRTTGHVDDSYQFEIEGVYLTYSSESGEIYYLPNDLKLSYNIIDSEETYDLFMLISHSDFYKGINVYVERGGDALELDEDGNTLTISTTDAEKNYSLRIEAWGDSGKDVFYLTNVKIKNEETHHYFINNWEGLTSDLKAVTLGIDEDSDGKIDLSIDLENGMTGEEIQIIIMSKGKSDSAFLTTSLLLIVGFVSIAGIGCLIGSSEVGKLALISLILPLYTRIKKEEVLDNEIRGMIRGYIIANPGDNYNSIKRALDLNNGTLAHHLRVLERADVIQSKQDGMFKRFYPASMKIPRDNGGEISEIQRILLSKIAESPGINQKEIASLLGLSKGVVSYHVKMLLGKQLLRIEKRGRKTFCYVDPKVEHRIKDNSFIKYEV